MVTAHCVASRSTFTAFVSLDADVEYERQRWEAGLRLHSEGLRARVRIQLTLWCEAVTRLEPNRTPLPDAVVRVRVSRSDLRCDHLVFEHVAGLGGEAAKLRGEAVRSSLHQLRPSLERNLLARANAAIVKGGDTKEVRLSVFGLLGKK